MVQGFRAALAKMLLDQGMFAPAFITIFVGSASALQGLSFQIQSPPHRAHHPVPAGRGQQRGRHPGDWNICRLLDKNPVLMASHSAQLHTLFGLYSMSMNQMDQAENQLNAELRTSTERELWTFANLNLAIVYLRSRREQDFMALLDRNPPDKLPSQSQGRRFLHPKGSSLSSRPSTTSPSATSAKMANAEDLNRLMPCLSLGNRREYINMVTPAMQLASKIPDVNIQLWAAAILKELYRMLGDPVGEAKGSSMHTNFTNSIAKDIFQVCQELEHQLINWTDAPFPTLTPAATNNAQAY